MKDESSAKYLKLIVFIALIIATYFIVRPFLNTIITAIVVTIIFYPAYRVINKLIKNNTLSSTLVTLIIILLIVIPSIIGAGLVAKESYKLYIMTKQRVYSGNILNVPCWEVNSTICDLNAKAKEWFTEPKNKYYFDDVMTKVTNFVFDSASKVIASLPKMIFNLFIMFFMMFFLFRDGGKLMEFFKSVIPFRRHEKDRIIKRVEDILGATLYGSIVIFIRYLPIAFMKTLG